MGGKEKGGQLGELVLAFGFEELRRDVGQDGGWSLGDSAELEVGGFEVTHRGAVHPGEGVGTL